MTVKEIAELAGVSIGTIDRVLYKRGRVSPETRAKVEAIIEQYQFTPNPIARRLKRNRAYLFYAFVPRRDQDSGYWGQVIEGIQAGASEVSRLGVTTEIIEFDRYNPAAFNAAAEKILKANPDGIVFAPIMPGMIFSFIGELAERSIPCVTVDADHPDMEPLCAIGQDPFRGGYLAGRLMHLFTGTPEKPVAVLDVHGEDYHITRRRDGFLHYAAEHNIRTVVKEYSDDIESEFSEEEIMDFLDMNPELAGIFITNCFAHRVAGAVKRNARNDIIVGYDLIPDNFRLLREGSVKAIISQRPKTQGREALLNLYRRIVLEMNVPEKVEMPLDVFIQENLPTEI